MRLAVLAYSPLDQDARILRQVEALRRRHDVMIVAESPAPADLWGADFRPLPPATSGLAQKMRALRRRAGVWFGMRVRDWLVRPSAQHRFALKCLRDFRPDAILCNELHPLAASREFHRATGCPVLVDLHEFYPADTKSGGDVARYDRPNIDWALRDAAQWAAGATAVNEMIARRYQDDYGLDCGVIYNAPRLVSPPVFRPVNPECIELVHVGVIHAERRPEVMAEAVVMAGAPWRIHFYLAGEREKIAAFRAHWHGSSGGRVVVHETVPVSEIESAIAGCDLGIAMTAPLSWNWLMGSPDKFFSYIAAGLGMILGPKPWKQMMNGKWAVAEMTPGFEAEDLAATLRALTPERVNELKRSAVAAAPVLNGDVEGEKLLQLCEGLKNRASHAQTAAVAVG